MAAQDYFDFRAVREENEELDFENLTECPHCKKKIPSGSTLCLYCGETVYISPGKRGLKLWFAGILIFIIILYLVLR